MTLTEIHHELFKDFCTLKNKLIYCKKDFQRKVLKASHYPLTYSYECYTKVKKNLFNIRFTAIKRSGRKNPSVAVYGLYNRPEGIYAATLSLEEHRTTIYPPHFFKRYRERIENDFVSSNKDIIKRYFATDWGYAFSIINKEIEAVYHSFENKSTDDKVGFVCVTSAGYCFGEAHGDNIFIMKTIVSEDMLFDSQKEVFSNLRKDFIKVSKELYGINIPN
ncbi:MAG: hypothetical protein WC622_00765 [Pedobacter sp.]|jgi:hypothetical protein|uniref:hypothetical protein n=1 Tax=Pedobacter sp. TaxID=1411316 RepID=UPI00356A4452